MRVIVAGSRGITSKAMVIAALREAFLWEGINPTCVVSGARGGFFGRSDCPCFGHQG